MNTNIYILIDPSEQQVRYVGKCNDPNERYKAHKNGARDIGTHKRNWVESLKRKGLKPIMEIVDNIPIGEWQFWERWWIGYFKSLGFKLVNYTEGGDGTSFGNQTTWKKGNVPWNRGLPISDEVRQKVIDARALQTNLRNKYVIQMDLSGRELCEHRSLTDAALSVEGSNSHISQCCKGKRNSHKGYKWKYK